MSADLESWWGQVLQIAWAGVDLKNLGAHRAVEMVVVPMARHLIAHHRALDFDRVDGAGILTIAQGAIDGGDTESRQLALGFDQEFLRRQRTRRMGEDGFDDLSLAGAAFHRYPA